MLGFLGVSDRVEGRFRTGGRLCRGLLVVRGLRCIRRKPRPNSDRAPSIASRSGWQRQDLWTLPRDVLAVKPMLMAVDLPLVDAQ